MGLVGTEHESLWVGMDQGLDGSGHRSEAAHWGGLILSANHTANGAGWLYD